MSEVERVGSNIEITGVRETVAALKAFTPEIAKALNKEIKTVMGKTQAVAQMNYPKGAWQIKVNSKKILGSIMARGGGSVGKSWGDSSPGIRAAIFEFAGHNQPGKTPQAQGLIRSLNSRYGTPGRFLWAAWDATGLDVMDRIKLAVEAAERDLQAALDAAGEGY